MANIMNIAQIRNKPSRNGFDLSEKINFTAKCGELLPVWWTPVLPTDSVRGKIQSFVRTQPLNSSAFARLRGYYDFYFVPFSQMWNKFNTAITQMNTNLQHASGPVLSDNVAMSGDLPYITAQQIAEYIYSLGASVNAFGFSRALLTCKLLEYLGYGDFYYYVSAAVEIDGVSVSGIYRPDGTPLGGYQWTDEQRLMENLMFSPFPLMAYQKIYADYNRYTQWERSNPSTFNCDYVTGSSDYNLDLTVSGFTDSFNFLDIRYCNWQRDLFHGVLPQAQYGEASVAEIENPFGSSVSLDGSSFNLRTSSGSSGQVLGKGASSDIRIGSLSSGMTFPTDSGVSIASFNTYGYNLT